jgi:hypothetical protein
MKTFEEALRLLVQPITGPGEARQRLEQMAAKIKRYEPLAEKIYRNADAQAFICTFVKPDCPQETKDALMHLFINGVIIGLEMHREERPQ